MTNTTVTTTNITEGTLCDITERAYIVFENNKWLLVVDNEEIAEFADRRRATSMAHTLLSLNGN